MRRQTLLQVVAFAALAVVLWFLSQGFRAHDLRAMQASGQREAALGAMSLRISGAFRDGRAYRDGAWEVREFLGGGLGLLRLATEPSDGTPWEALCVRWLGMPGYGAGPLRFESRGYRWFFKEVPLFGRGAYVLGKRGKQVRFIAFFEREGVRHWVGLDAREAFSTRKDVFDAMLASLRTPDGNDPGPRLQAALEPVLREGGVLFVPPPEAVFLIPALAMGAVGLIQWALRRRAGRLPGPAGPAVQIAAFSEAGAEIGLLRPWQRKFLDAAVVVDGRGLTVHTFGTPFMTVPRRAWSGPAGQGNAWLGLPYLQLELVEPPEFHKWKPFYRRMKPPLSIRIYTREPDRLRIALG